jgi:Tfp pilus assembly protein PilF
MPGRTLSRKRTVNVKAALILVVGGAVLLAGTMALHAFQVERGSRALLAQAERAEADGERTKEARILTEYLGLNPKDTKVLAHYGLLLKRMCTADRKTDPNAFVQQHQNAYLALDKALRSGEDGPEVRRAYAAVAVELGLGRDAREHLEALRKTPPDDPDLEELLGRCLEQVKEYDAAERALANACRLKPERVEAALRRAGLLRERLKLPQTADEAVAAMVAANPRSRDARLGAAGYYAAFAAEQERRESKDDKESKDEKESEKLWYKAEGQWAFAYRELDANRAEDYLLGARIAQGRRDLASAAKLLGEGVRRHREDVPLRLSKARLEVALGTEKSREEALKTLKPLAERPPAGVMELIELAYLLMDLGQDDKAREVVAKLPPRGLGPIVNYFRGSLDARQGKWGEARRQLEDALDGPKLNPLPRLKQQGFLTLALCQGRLNNPEGELAACRRALEIDRTWLPALLMEADILRRRGKLDDAARAIDKIAERDPKRALSLALSRLEVDLRRQLALPADKRKWDEVDRQAKALPKDQADSLQGLLLRADLAAARDQPQEARKVLEKARDDYPKEVRPWLALSRLAAAGGKTEAALAVLAEAEKKLPHNVSLIAERMRLSLLQPTKEVRRALGQFEKEAQDYPEAERAALRALLADAYARRGGDEGKADAVRLWKELAKDNPKDLDSRLRLFDAASSGKKWEEMELLTADVQGLEGGPAGPLGSWMDAARLVALAREAKEAGNEEGKSESLRRARRRLEEVRKSRPSWGALLLLEAEAFFLDDNPAKGLEKCRLALDQGEFQPTVLRRVAADLMQHRRGKEAWGVLGKVPVAALEAAGLLKMVWELEIKHGDGDLAERQKRVLERAELLAKGSKDPNDSLFLAQMAEVAEQLPKAEAAYRRTVELAPEAPEGRLALIAFLVRSDPAKDKAKARTALKEAETQLKPAAATLVAAAGLEVLGEVEAARKKYQELLQKRPAEVTEAAVLEQAGRFFTTHGPPDEAEKCWKSLLEDGKKLPDRGRAAVKRQLAGVLASQGTRDKVKEALNYVEENLKSPDAAPEDKRLKALLLASQPGGRRAAIELLEELYKKGELGPVDVARLAHLYEADGKWAKARPMLTALVIDEEKNTDLVADVAQTLLRNQGEAASVAPLVEVLKKREPGTARTVTLEVLLLDHQGETDKAAQKTREFASAKDAPEGNLAVAAALLEQIGRPVTDQEHNAKVWDEATKPGATTSRSPAKRRAYWRWPSTWGGSKRRPRPWRSVTRPGRPASRRRWWAWPASPSCATAARRGSSPTWPSAWRRPAAPTTNRRRSWCCGRSWRTCAARTTPVTTTSPSPCTGRRWSGTTRISRP